MKTMIIYISAGALDKSIIQFTHIQSSKKHFNNYVRISLLHKTFTFLEIELTYGVIQNTL